MRGCCLPLAVPEDDGVRRWRRGLRRPDVDERRRRRTRGRLTGRGRRGRPAGAVEDGLPVGARLERVEPAATLGPGDVGEATHGRLRGVLQAVGMYVVFLVMLFILSGNPTGL